jgi:cytochrome P450
MDQPRAHVPPGPPPVGNSPLALWRYQRAFSRDPIAFVKGRFDTYGDIYRLLFRGTPVYVLRHPDHLTEVLVQRGAAFAKPTRGLAARQLRRFLGDGLVTSNGELWRRQRRLINPAFARERLLALAPIMTEHAVAAVARWRDGATVEVGAELMALTLRIVCKALFDHDTSSETDSVAGALAAFRDFSGVPLLVPDWLPLPGVLRMRRAVATMDAIVYGLIDRRAAEPREILARRPDLLATLLLMSDEEAGEGERHMTRRQLRDEILTLFLAGHETTAQALTWTLYLLSQHPEAEARLHAELDAVLRGRPPTAEDELPYTDRVIAESMRLFPPAPVVARVCVEATEVGGYPVPVGADVACWIYHAHHDPRWWEDPERFDPDRFTEERSRERPRGAYAPFGAGQRLCVGRGFALLEARLLLATIAQRFRLRLLPGHPVARRLGVTLSPRHGMRMVLSRRA